MGKEESCPAQPLPSWLSAAFLQTVLRAGEDDPNLTVTHCHVSSATGKGDNFLGTLYRASATTSTAEKRSLIIKCVPMGEQQEIYVRQAALFDIEIEMYTKTLPKMYGILRETYSNFKPFTAKFLYSNPQSEVIVLEDLSAKGFKMAKRQHGLDLQHCTLLLKSLAVFHAASVAAHAKSPMSMESYKEGIFKESTREFLEMYFTSSIQSLIEELQNWPDFKERYTEKLNCLIDTCWDRISEALARDEIGFNVLNHGDLWVNNVMFHYSETDEVEEVMFLDLQNTHFASPAVDLLYFFYTSPSDEVRLHHFDSLIQTYQQTLSDTLTKLGYGEKAPTLELLQKELKQRMSLALFATICELPNMLAEPDDGFDIGDYFTESEKQPKNKTYSGEQYKRVIQRLLPIFESYGIL